MLVDLRQLVLHWYNLLAEVNRAAVEPLTALSDGIGVPLVAALLLGLLGATSPCQLTTNAGALAFVARRAAAAPRAPVVSAVAYLLGKVLVYTALGTVVVLAGREVATSTIPLIVAARKALGPLRHWLGLTEPSSPRSTREHWEGGLLATWRLSQALAQPSPARQAPARPSYPITSYRRDG